MFPFRDDNPQLRVPYVVFAIIALNVLVWVFVEGLGSEPALSRSICVLGLIPGEVLGHVDLSNLSPDRLPCPLDEQGSWFTVLSSMFMHGGWMHIIGNMWFLWIFGDNVEDAMGRARFAIFYLLCGCAAAATQMLMSPGSPIPMVGASGAIGGVMGAYIVLYPRVNVHMLLILGFYVTTIAVPAFWMLGYWILLQLISGLASAGAAGSGVAFWAHVGGFGTGALLVLLFKNERLLAGHPYRGWRQPQQPSRAWRRIDNDRWR